MKPCIHVFARPQCLARPSEGRRRIALRHADANLASANAIQAGTRELRAATDLLARLDLNYARSSATMRATKLPSVKHVFDFVDREAVMADGL
jgi:hypothetical protein